MAPRAPALSARLAHGPANRYQRYAHESALEAIGQKEAYEATISRITKT